MKNQHMPVVQEGWPFAAIAGLSFLVCVLAGWWTLAGLAAVATAYVLFFFRNPERHPPADYDVVASPADGKVIFAEEAIDREFSSQKMVKISIFMNLFDVHVNRMPVDGIIRDRKYSCGRFMAASESEASDENERSALSIETDHGQMVTLVQVAGLVARRIVTYPSSGMLVSKGERIGLIKFGSRCDLYLPLGSELLVKVGDRVLGGSSGIARLSAVEQ